MFVRTAGSADLNAIRALLGETWHATYDAIYGADRVADIHKRWHSKAELASRLEKPETEFLVADDGTAIAGMAFASYDAETRKVTLHQLYVRPAMQGHGVGGLLLDEIEGCFPGAETVRLEVDAANMRAVAFYIGQGFSKVGETADCGETGSGLAADIYERPILWAD